MRELSIHNFESIKRFVKNPVSFFSSLKLDKGLQLQRCYATFFIPENLHRGHQMVYNSRRILYKHILQKTLFAIFYICLCSGSFAQGFNPVTVTTNAVSPASTSVMNQYLFSGGVTSNLIYNNQDGPRTLVLKMYGSIVSTSTSPSFTISLRPGYVPQQTISINRFATHNIAMPELMDAFGSFMEGNLISSDPANFPLASFRDANNNIRLPSGSYNVCLDARLVGSNGVVTDTIEGEGCGKFTISCTQSINSTFINTTVGPSVNPILAQLISRGGVSARLQYNDPLGCINTGVKLFGKIERITPSPFSIFLKPDYQQQQFIRLIPPGSFIPLTQKLLADAFANFNESYLGTEGIDLASIKDASNQIKLPDGNYRICFYARYFTTATGIGDNASDPNIGCGTFTICSTAGGAPQFTQPVSNFNINSDISVVQPASPLIFTWTPPQSACGLPPGGYTYDFEIRELFPGQGVTDALNNPFVFRKTGLPSTTFLLDTNLNRNVLHEGRRYAIRVRAVSINTNSPVEIDNNGYSRIEAFQYGGNILTHNGFNYEPEDFYIPFIERKSGFWDDVYSAYRKHTRGDTLVPIKEYIAFALTQNLTAYNVDGIELFLALNPELAELKKVKVSYTPKLPEFPVLPANDQNNFDKEHETNLEPDKFEENKFLKYLDTLNNLKQKIPANAAAMISDLASHLNSIKTGVDSMDRVSVNLINMVLSELLYELHRSSQPLNKSQLNQLQGLVSTLRDLTAPSSGSTSLFYRFPGDIQSSLSSYRSNTGGHRQKISLVNNTLQITDYSPDHLLSAVMKQLLPFDVIVYRYNKGTPAQPLLDAPDLSKTYRVFYALQNLYNHKNPEVNAKSTTHLASTVQVSLPSNTVFTFWTLNMLTHKNTKPEDVDLKDVLSHTNKILPGLKKPSIVLKVE